MKLTSREEAGFFPFGKSMGWIEVLINAGYQEVRHVRHKPDWLDLIVDYYAMCPFLMVDEGHIPTCLFYEERPQHCREFVCWEVE